MFFIHIIVMLSLSLHAQDSEIEEQGLLLNIVALGVNTYMASRVNDRLGIVLPSVGLMNHGDMVLTSFKVYNQEKVSLILHGGGLALNIIALRYEAEEQDPDMPLIISLVVNSAILSYNIWYMLYKTESGTKDNSCLIENKNLFAILISTK